MPRKRNGCPRRRSPILPVDTCDVQNVTDNDIASCSFPSRCLTSRVFEIFARNVLRQAQSQSQATNMHTLSTFLEGGGRFFPSVIFIPVYCPRKKLMSLAEVTGLRRRNGTIRISFYVPSRGEYVSPRRTKRIIKKVLVDTIKNLQRRGHLVSVRDDAISRLKLAKFRRLRLPIAKDVESSFFLLKRIQHVAYGIDVSGRGAFSKYEVRRLRRFLVCSLF